MRKRALVLDIDGTLIHGEFIPGAVVIPGRTRPAYLAPETLRAIQELSRRYQVVIATARSLAAAQPVLASLAGCLAGVILEDGAVIGRPGSLRGIGPTRPWAAWRKSLQSADLPPFEWQMDFEACLVARAESHAEADVLLANLLPESLRAVAGLRVFRDGRKVYITGQEADKWQALVSLLGAEAEHAVGAGDGLNDICWLAEVALPLTFRDASEAVKALVHGRGGYVTPFTGHAGIGDLLTQLRA